MILAIIADHYLILAILFMQQRGPPNLIVATQLEKGGLEPFGFFQLYTHRFAGITAGYRIHDTGWTEVVAAGFKRCLSPTFKTIVGRSGAIIWPDRQTAISAGNRNPVLCRPAPY